MALQHLISELKGKLSSQATILTDPSSKEFELALLRWSDVNVQVPGAIIQVANEDDVAASVKAASIHKIPFVPVCGGHSLWSTIGPDGFILDFSRYKNVQVHADAHEAIIIGGVLMKELSTALADVGECAAVGNANTVGVIPYLLGGGIGVATGLMGIACDNMLSAKIILADGRLVKCDNEHERDLFWAIKGAGFYFGVVVEITLRTYPLSIFGTQEGRHWIGNYIYPFERAVDVFGEVSKLIESSKSRTAGLFMVVSPPPHFKPAIVVVPHYFGDLKDGPMHFQSLADLEPVFYQETMPLVPNLSDHLDFACGKGGFRRFTLAGLRKFESANCLKLVELYKELLDSCPDAAASGYFIEWHCLPPSDKIADSAFSHHDVHIWIHCLSWCQKQEHWDSVAEFEKRAIEIMRLGSDVESYVDLPHGTRTGPIERRFGGKQKLSKLRALKKQFDPQGIFTKELL